MKAAVCERYGPPEVLKIKNVEKPSPKAGEVLINVKLVLLILVMQGSGDYVLGTVH